MTDTPIARLARQVQNGKIAWAGQPEMNVGQVERVATAIVGSAMFLAALRRAPLALLLTLLGGGLLLRALNGRCSIYEALGINTAGNSALDATLAVPAEPDHLPHSDDPVDYSSEDSFPASDPPAFNA